MDERVLALQKTLEMKKLERQQKRESEKAKANVAKQVATQKVKSYIHEKVSKALNVHFTILYILVLLMQLLIL